MRDFLTRHPKLEAVLLALLLTVAYSVLAVLATWPVPAKMDEWILGGGELGGWLWRYWLMKMEIDAILQEVGDDPIRAFFTIISLGRFPETGNITDLLVLSLPLEKLLGHPTYYNLKCLILMVTNCLAGYTLFHYLTRRRLVAFVAGATFGFNSFVFYEIFLSGLRQAVLCFIPLMVLFLEKTLNEKRWRDAALAGLFFAFTAIFYWFYGLFTAMYTTLRLLWYLWEKRRDLQLGKLIPRLALMSTITLGLSAIFVYPYVAEEYRDPGAPGLPEVQWFTDFPTLTELAGVPTVPTNPRENLLASLSRVIPSSWSLDWLFNPLHQRQVPVIMLLMAVVAAFLRWRMVTFWLITFLFFYVMTGGPYLKLWDRPGSNNFVFLGEFAIRLPYAWAFKYVPLMSRLFAPYRMGSFAVLALSVLLALNLAALFRWLGQRAALHWGVAVVFLGLYFGQFFGDHQLLKAAQLEGYGRDRGLPIFSSPLHIHEWFEELGKEEGQIGVIHLPLMYQQDLLTYYQLVHGKKVLLQTGWANPGALPPLLRFSTEPRGDLTPHLQYLFRNDPVAKNTFVNSLLNLNRPPHVFPPYRISDVESLMRSGYRYILLHERGCYMVRPDAGTRLYGALRKKLIKRFGEPLAEVKEFEATYNPLNQGGHVVAGVEVPWVSTEPPLIPSKRPLVFHMSVFAVKPTGYGTEGDVGDTGPSTTGVAGEGVPTPPASPASSP